MTLSVERDKGAKPDSSTISPSPPSVISQLFTILETGIFPDDKPEWRWMAEVLDGGWKEEGNCWDTDSDLYFPTRDTTLSAVAGKEVCAECPVALDCFTYAIFSNQQLGTWGGESPDARRDVRRVLGLIGT